MVEIKKILDDYDVAGIVVIHTPGNTEYLAKLETGYSACKVDGEKLHVRAKLEDFQGNKAARDKKLADTSNMFKMLTETTIEVVYPLVTVSDELDKKLGAEHSDGGHTTSITQDN